MAQLRKYQIEAITQEVIYKIQEQNEKKTNTTKYKKEIKKIESQVDKDYLFGQLEELKKIEEQARKQSQELKSIIVENAKKDGIKLGHLYSYSVEKLRDQIIKESSKNLNEKVGIKDINRNKIENLIIISDLRGVDNIIDEVIKKL